MNTLLKIHEKIKKNIISISIALVLIPVILLVIVPHKKYYPWKFAGDVVQIPFSTDDDGLMFIRISFNDTSGIFFVDTGCDITCIKESLLNTEDTVYLKRVTDSQSISAKRKMTRVANFKVAEIEFQSFKVLSYDESAWGENGFFHTKDSVIGVLGNDFLSKFICEFNMEKHEISFFNPDKYPTNIPDSLAIPFIKKGRGFFIEIEIDSLKYPVKFDSGCGRPLVLKDSFSIPGIDLQLTGTTRSFLSHLKKNSSSNHKSIISVLPQITLGVNTFESVLCSEKAKTNLLGIPFFWSFDKVVADYPNKKVYFVNRQNRRAQYGILNHMLNTVRNAFLQKRGYVISNSTDFIAHNILLIKRQKMEDNTPISDTIPSQYKIFGEAKWYGKNLSSLDSIICSDSLMLPNGKMVYDNYKINAKEKYFFAY